ncbi:MAG: long-chain-fatty-acid--CoA ligase [Elusimicrobia bacterium]|nr:long-chain-fatty-acid--CoA ligase [Elusimicrobiota bacterium]
MDIKTLNDLIDDAALESGDRTAYITAEESITYAELRRRVLSTAAGFRAAGVKKGDCVAIVHRNSPIFVQAYMGLTRIGAIAVPLNWLVQKPDELAYMLNDCKAVGVVTQKEFLKGLRAAGAKTSSLRSLWVSDAVQSELQGKEIPFPSLNGDPKSLPSTAVDEKDTASILYTSGTTGNPKGVMLTHKNFITNCDATLKRMQLKSSDVGLCILPMFHSFAWTGKVLICLRLKAKLVIAPAIAPPKPWLSLMGWHGVTLFAAVPQVYSVLSKQCCGFKSLYLRWFSFRKVRIAISGAAPLSPAVQSDFEKTFGIPILEGFGLTETSPVVTINALDKRKPGSVGTAIDGVRIKLVDDSERELPPGGEGEICVKGDCVMKGYYNLPDATRDAYTKDGWLKTGDIGAIDPQGFLFIRDRKKDMIIIKGLKVFSAQVEAVLLENPAIEEAAIIGIPDEHGDETIKAFIVLKKNAAADKASLMQFCRAKFDAYKRPRDIEIVDALPKNALQKVLKRALRQKELEKKAAGAA